MNIKKLNTQSLYLYRYIRTYISTPINNNNSNNNNIHSNDNEDVIKNRIQVKNLYKQFLYLGRIGFLGVDYIRDKAKPQFMKNASLTDQYEITKCIDRAKYVLKEIEAMNRFHKYRSLKKSYDPEFQHIRDDFLNLLNKNDNNNNK